MTANLDTRVGDPPYPPAISTGRPNATSAWSRAVHARRSRRRLLIATLASTLAVLAVVSLMVGQTFYPLTDVLAVLRGEIVPGASFTVGELRLPRTALAVVAGAAFGLAGATFQTILRNPLASPDVIGISAGASAAAVLSLVVLDLDSDLTSWIAVASALATALAIYLLAYRDGFTGDRLILIGIGVAAILDSVVAYAIVRASAWDLQTAMRWLTGSLNSAEWQQVLPVALALVVLGPLLLTQARSLSVLEQGDDSAQALGVGLTRTRLTSIIAAVALIAFATAATGPIAFVALLAGPIAVRIVGPAGSVLVPAALVGALLVLGGDLVGQYAFENRYPVGVVTGALGAPYLVLLLIRSTRSGGPR